MSVRVEVAAYPRKPVRIVVASR